MSHRPFHPSELDDVADPLESADLLLMARELERLDGGSIRPSDGFTERVLAAIGEEPLPAPMAVAGLAARQGRFGAMVAALRDTWHVAWSGGRPLAVRAQAMAFVLLLVIAVGSVGAVTTVGAFNVLFPSTSTPSVPLPSVPAVASPLVPPSTSPSPSPSPAPIAAPTPSPTETTEPTETPETETDKHTARPGQTEKPGHTETPEPTETPETGDDSGGGGHGSGETEDP